MGSRAEPAFASQGDFPKSLDAHFHKSEISEYESGTMAIYVDTMTLCIFWRIKYRKKSSALLMPVFMSNRYMESQILDYV